MKHLKTYLETNIMDILEDVNDMSYDKSFTVRDVLAGTFVNIKDRYVEVGINFGRKSKYSNIKNVINHLINYLRSEGYSDYCYVDHYTMFNDRELTRNILPRDNDDVKNIRLYLYSK